MSAPCLLGLLGALPAREASRHRARRGGGAWWQPPAPLACPPLRSSRTALPCSRRGTDGSVHPFAAEGSAFAPGKESSRDSLTELLHLLATRRQAKGGDEAPLPGKVYLVGTGPGSPELLTLHAGRLREDKPLKCFQNPTESSSAARAQCTSGRSGTV